MSEHIEYDIKSFTRLNLDELLKTASKQNYISYHSLCQQEIQNSKYPDTSSEFIILRLFATLCSMGFASNNLQEPFSPLWQIDGKRSYILSDFSKNELLFLEECFPLITNHKIRARIADMCWTRNKKKIQYARIAISEYFSPHIEHDEFIYDGYEMWKRGIYLSIKLKGDFFEQLAPHRIKLIDTFSGLPHCENSFGIRVAKLLFEICNSKEIFTTITKILIQWGDHSFKEHSWHWARNFYQEALRWHQHFERDNTESISDIIHKIGFCWETEASQRQEGFMLSGLAYADALKTYRQIPRAFRAKYGIDEKLIAIQQKMSHANQSMERELTHIKTEGIDLSDAVKHAHERMKGKDPLSSLVILANISPKIKKSDLEKQTEEMLKNSPLASIIPSKYYAKDGRVVAISPGISNDLSSPESEATLHCQLMRLYGLQISITVLASIRPALDIFNSEQLMTEGDLFHLCCQSPIISDDRALIWAKGLFYGFKEEYIEAIHLLIPQLEHLIRTCLKANKIKTSIVDSNGIENEMGLSSLLDIPQIIDVIPVDVLFEIKALLSDQPGPNLRNEIAHGLITTDEASGNNAIYFWWFCLKLMVNSLPINPQDLNL